MTQNALLKALEVELGAKFSVEHVDIAKIKAQSARALERGDIGKAMRGLTLSSVFNDEDGGSDLWDLEENTLVGVKPVTVGEAVKETFQIWGANVQPVQAFLSVQVEEDE